MTPAQPDRGGAVRPSWLPRDRSWGPRFFVVVGVVLLAVTGFVLVRHQTELDCGRRGVIELELAGTESRSGDVLTSVPEGDPDDDPSATCTKNGVREAIAWYVLFIVLFAVLLGGAARLAGPRGYRLKALRDRSQVVVSLVVVAVILGVAANVALFVGLENEGALRIRSGWAEAAAVAGWAKFVLLAVVVVYVVGALLGYVVTPNWIREARRGERTSTKVSALQADDAGPWTTGLCLSGGGVRSASFGLGALQLLDEREAPLGWRRAGRATSVSGGSYMAAAWQVSRTPQRDAPFDTVDAEGTGWREASVEEGHLRDHLGYLLRTDPRSGTSSGLPGALATLVAGLLMNVAVLAGLLWIAARPLGWLEGSWVVAPALRLPYGDDSRSFALGGHQWIPSAVWFAIAATLLLIWIFLGRFRATPGEGSRLQKSIAWGHASLKPIVVGTFVIGAVLGLLLVVVPWAMLQGPSVLRGMQTGGEADKQPSAVSAVLMLLSSLGIVGAIVAIIKKPLGKLAPKLGGVLLLLIAVLLGGLWASDAAMDGLGYGYLVVGGVWVVAYWLFNPEWWSMAPFYRGRLRSAYATFRLGTGDACGYRNGDGPDDEVVRAEPSLHEYVANPAGSPRLDICATMTVSDASSTTHYGIPAYSFTFNPEHVSYFVPNEQDALAERVSCPTHVVDLLMHRWDTPRLTTMAAVGVSGAAVSPAMGRASLGTTDAFLAFANLRLGLWIPNPRYLQCLPAGDVASPVATRAPEAVGIARRGPAGWLPFPRVRISYLLKELTRIHDPDDLYVYITDGGHWENTGLVELVRDGTVDEVVCLDASGVSIHSVTSLAEAITLAPIESGVNVRMGFDPVRVGGDGRYAPRSVTVGLITKPTCVDDVVVVDEDRIGLLWYAKPVLTRETAARLLAYRERDDQFPAHGTLDQFFDTEQFEAYRMLGTDAARQILAARAKLFDALRECENLAGLQDRRGTHWVIAEVADLLASEAEFVGLKRRLPKN